MEGHISGANRPIGGLCRNTQARIGEVFERPDSGQIRLGSVVGDKRWVPALHGLIAVEVGVLRRLASVPAIAALMPNRRIPKEPAHEAEGGDGQADDEGGHAIDSDADCASCG